MELVNQIIRYSNPGIASNTKFGDQLIKIYFFKYFLTISPSRQKLYLTEEYDR